MCRECFGDDDLYCPARRPPPPPPPPPPVRIGWRGWLLMLMISPAAVAGEFWGWITESGKGVGHG